jgi:hypothetical protein
MKRIFPLLWAAGLAVAMIALPAASAVPAAHITLTDAGEVSTSYNYLADNFYKKVDPQVVLDSVRAELIAAMRTAGVKQIVLPAMHASGSPSGNAKSRMPLQNRSGSFPCTTLATSRSTAFCTRSRTATRSF